MLGDSLGKRGRATIEPIDRNRTHLWKVAVDILARMITRRTEPHVKLH